MNQLQEEQRAAIDREIKDRLARQNLVADYLATFDSLEGRRVLRDLLLFTGAFPMGEPFTGNSRIYFDAGRRSVASLLLVMLGLTGTDAQQQFVDAWLQQLGNFRVEMDHVDGPGGQRHEGF